MVAGNEDKGTRIMIFCMVQNAISDAFFRLFKYVFIYLTKGKLMQEGFS